MIDLTPPLKPLTTGRVLVEPGTIELYGGDSSSASLAGSSQVRR